MVRCTFLLLLFAVGCGESYKDDPQALEVTKWVLSKGGTVNITTQDVTIKSVDKIPTHDFGILKIDLNEKEYLPIDLEKLTGLTNIKYLGLYNGKLSAKNISFVTVLETLEELEISYTQISDAELQQIGQMLPRLKTIYLYGTAPAVTDEGVKAFQEQLPNCKVMR